MAKFLATRSAETFSGSAAQIDTVSYERATAGVIASLENESVNTGWAAGDHYVSIENLTGSWYNDTLVGNSQDNVLDGGAGDDIIYGRAGNDKISGGLQTDYLFGDEGSDVLNGGFGNDFLAGGADADFFVFERFSGKDTVLDFHVSEGDKLVLSSQTPTDIHDISGDTLSGQGALVTLSGGGLIYLPGVDSSDMLAHPTDYFVLI